MNSLDMYISWRNHEPEPNKFDFETYNIRAFLDLCKKHGLFVYVRYVFLTHLSKVFSAIHFLGGCGEVGT